MRTILQKILFLIALLIISGSDIHATEYNTNSIVRGEFDFEKVNVGQDVKKKNAQQKMTDREITLKMMADNRFYVILLAIMFLVSLVTTLLLSSSSRTSRDIVTISGLNLVVFGSMISVLIVDTTEALGAIMGILGSMGGYLFGSWDKREKE